MSRIRMGCVGFGHPPPPPQAGQCPGEGEEDSRAVIRHGLESGINFFDTALAYRGSSSECFPGRALRGLCLPG